MEELKATPFLLTSKLAGAEMTRIWDNIPPIVNVWEAEAVPTVVENPPRDAGTGSEMLGVRVVKVNS